MLGYKLKINNIPECVWACETTVVDYMWKNRNKKDMLEISFSKFPSKTVLINDQKFILKKNDLSCVIADINREGVCETGDEITIVSVCVKIHELKYSACDFCDDDYYDHSAILLPAYIEDLPLSDEIELLKIMHKIIKIAPDIYENTRAIFISEFFNLLHTIDALTRKALQQTNSGITDINNYYIKKTNYIIDSQYSKKLSLNEVASILNLSSVYLSSFYKKHSGMTFSDKLLQVRMKHAEALLCDQNIPTAKVASLCGFCDENYFRKQFKKFFGINIKEYRALKNGITLYHDKPIRENYTK